MGYIKLYNINNILYVIYYVRNDNTNINPVDITEFLCIVTTDTNIRFNFYYRAWVFDINYFESFLKKYNKYHIEIDNSRKDFELYSDIGNSLKLKPFEYQREIVDFILKTKNVLLVSPCGSGKSLIGICSYKEFLDRNIISNMGLIVVKASLKYQWKSEVEKFSDLKANIIETPSFICRNINSKIKRLEAKKKNYKANKNTAKLKEVNAKIKELKEEAKNTFLEQFNGYQLLILNYETLFNDKVKEQIKNTKIDFIFVDEIHLIGNVNAKRSRAVSSLEATVRIGATATPITKNPGNIYSIFKFIKPGLFRSAAEFDNDYLIKNIFNAPTGLKNYKQLHNTISQYMIRKTIEDIGKQLPELMVIPTYIDLDPAQNEMYDKILEDISNLKRQKEQLVTKKNNLLNKLFTNKINDEIDKIDANISGCYTCAQELCDSPELLLNSKMGQNYYCKVNNNAKLDMLFELIEQIIDSGEKVAVFSRYVRMLNLIAARVKSQFKDVNISYVTGELSAQERYNEVYEKFAKQDKYKIILMSDAGCEGINLRACKYLIEYDLAIDYAHQTQRHGRIQRADSIHKNVIVYQLIANNSYDISQQYTINKKKGFDTTVIQGKDLED